MKAKLCKICGEMFTPEKPSNTICKKNHYKECPICGKQVIWNSARKVEPCSKECRRELTKQKNIEKYGVEHPMQNKEVQQNHRQAIKKKYGVEHPLQSSKIKQKTIQTNINKFGTEWALGNKEVHNKVKETMMERYGAPTTWESAVLREKVEQTCLHKYGVDNVAKNKHIKEKVCNTNFLKYSAYDSIQNEEAYNKLCSSRKINHIVKVFGGLLQRNNIQFEYGEEFNILIPNQNIAIEINPSYSHNTIGNHWTNTGLDPMYHKIKSITAQEKGYRCIHVFDWDNWNMIIDMMKPRKPVHACDCVMYRLNKEIAARFLDENHLYGVPSGFDKSLSVGLAYNGELIQVMSFTLAPEKSNYDIELSRFCCKTGIAVSGGTKKLFKFATQGLGLDNIVSVCYLDKFTGEVYEDLGMDLVSLSDPQEIWSKNDTMIIVGDKVNYEILLDQGWVPVYDCGKKIFEFKQ